MSPAPVIARPALLVALALAAPCAAVAADWASVLTYNRFGDEGDPANTIRIDQFEAHLAEIARGGYTVLPLSEIVRALKDRQPLPDRAIAITIDDTHGSVYQHAWPRLKRAGLPFTLFVATETVDRSAAGYMNWSQVRELAQSGVEIGNLTASHPHLTMQGTDRINYELETASRRIREELDIEAKLFAYPYGEWSTEVRQLVTKAGFAAAFGQQSGVTHSGHDWFSLPRFPMNEQLGSLGRFRLAATALPIRVRELAPDDPMVTVNPPPIGFTVLSPIDRLDRLACFASSQSGPAMIERLGEQRIEVRLSAPLPPGRSRVNCTMPGEDNRWHWLGLLFFQPTER